MRLIARLPAHPHTVRLIFALALADTHYALSKQDTVLIDPITGKQVNEIATILKEEDVEKIYLYTESVFYLKRKQPCGASDPEQYDSNWRRFDHISPSSYISPGCLIFNSGVIYLRDWAYTKSNKKAPKDALDFLLTTMEVVPEKQIKGYLKSVSEAMKKLITSQMDILWNQKDRQSPENIHQLINYAIHYSVLMPTFVALVFCSLFPYGDPKSTTIFNDLARCFPEEIPQFSSAIDYHLLKSGLFNTRGILEKDGGTVSLDYVRMVALTLIGPGAYANLHILRAFGLKYCRGQLSHEEFKVAIGYLYVDRFYDNHKLDGKYNTNVYMTTKDKYCNDCTRWIHYTLRVGYLSVRFGYDIIGHILKVSSPGSPRLNLADKFNGRRQDFLVKYEAEFMKYSEEEVLYDSSDLDFTKLMSSMDYLGPYSGRSLIDKKHESYIVTSKHVYI